MRVLGAEGFKDFRVGFRKKLLDSLLSDSASRVVAGCRLFGLQTYSTGFCLFSAGLGPHGFRV